MEAGTRQGPWTAGDTMWGELNLRWLRAWAPGSVLGHLRGSGASSGCRSPPSASTVPLLPERSPTEDIHMVPGKPQGTLLSACGVQTGASFRILFPK